MKPWLGKILGKSELIDKAVDIADRFIDTPEEKKEFLKEAYKVEVKDREQARVNNQDKITPEVISYFTIVFTLFLGLALFGDWVEWTTLTEVQKGMIQTFLGVMLAKVNDIYGYWFGSSLGNDLKDKKWK
jgi:hypothetical protein